MDALAALIAGLVAGESSLSSASTEGTPETPHDRSRPVSCALPHKEHMKNCRSEFEPGGRTPECE